MGRMIYYSFNVSVKCYCFYKSNIEIILVYDEIKCNIVLKIKLYFYLIIKY